MSLRGPLRSLDKDHSEFYDCVGTKELTKDIKAGKWDFLMFELHRAETGC